MSHQVHYRSNRGRWPNQQCQSTEGSCWLHWGSRWSCRGARRSAVRWLLFAISASIRYASWSQSKAHWLERLSREAFHSLIQAFVNSRLDYCNSALLPSETPVSAEYGCSHGDWSTLMWSHQSNSWGPTLPVSQWVVFKTALMVWKCIQCCSCLPQRPLHICYRHVWSTALALCIQSKFTCSACADCSGEHSFAISGPTTWNSLLPALRAPELSENAFTRALKKHLFLTNQHRWDSSMWFRHWIQMHLLTYLLTYAALQVAMQSGCDAHKSFFQDISFVHTSTKWLIGWDRYRHWVLGIGRYRRYQFGISIGKNASIPARILHTHHLCVTKTMVFCFDCAHQRKRPPACA